MAFGSQEDMFNKMVNAPFVLSESEKNAEAEKTGINGMVESALITDNDGYMPVVYTKKKKGLKMLLISLGISLAVILIAAALIYFLF